MSLDIIKKRKSGFIYTFLNYIKYTPFHPQWLIYRENYKSLTQLSSFVNGKVLDIGCSSMEIRKFINEGCQYIGLDLYDTAIEWYHVRPHIFGDAQNLPIGDECIDVVFLLDVLEHLPYPEKSISEVRRVLVKGGIFIIQVPFVYPVHDAPLDFHRWTIYGLRKLAQVNKFSIIKEVHKGNPLESACLLFNIAASKIVLNWTIQKNPAALFIFLLPLIIFMTNILAYLSNFLTRSDSLMPWGYRMVLAKN